MYHFLLVQVSCIYADAGQNPRLYSQFLFVLLLDVPYRELAMENLTKDKGDEFIRKSEQEQHMAFIEQLKKSESRKGPLMMIFQVMKDLLREGHG